MNYIQFVKLRQAYYDERNSLAQTLKPYELTVGQWVVLSLVRNNPNITVTRLATILRTTLAFATTTANRLEARSLVSRSGVEGDARSKYLNCTEIAEEKIDAIKKSLGQGAGPTTS